MTSIDGINIYETFCKLPSGLNHNNKLAAFTFTAIAADDKQRRITRQLSIK